MKIAYCYNTNSKMISIEAMMRAYKTDYEVFSWKPRFCIAERQGGKWNIYYDDESLKECQKEVKRIFYDKRKLSKYFELANKVMCKLRQAVDTQYRKGVALNLSVCKQYMDLYSEFLNYYSFSNEFCFKLVEQEILERLQHYLNSKEIGIILSQTKMNNTYTYQAVEILKNFIDMYKREHKIHEEKIIEFIDKYQFLLKNVSEGKIKDYIVDSIKSGRLLFENIQMCEKNEECDEITKKCDDELLELVNNVLELRSLRLVMREEMVCFNFYFTKLLKNYLKDTYVEFFNDLDIANIIEILTVEQLFDIQQLDVTILHKGRTNTLIFADHELIPVNKFYGFESEYKPKEFIENNIISLTGQVVCGNGRVKGVIKTSLYEEDDNKPSIYLTKSLHPKDILMSKNIKAIIVDEGGILSHASIIAKELDIPCIINTKISSMVLEDGDTVSIDLNEGRIKLLDKKSDVHDPINELIPLSSALIDKNLYGNKCVNLCTYFDEFNVVDGFVLSAPVVEKLYKQIKYDGILNLSSKTKTMLQEMFPIIMRSSSLYEDCEKSTAAGLLESVTAIDNFDDFAEAIITICDSSKNNSTDKYLQMIGIENKQMPAILIQRFFDFEILGVSLVENKKATIEFKMQNEENFKDYVVNMDDKAELENINIINKLIPELNKLNDKDGMLVEFGFDAGKLYILQIRKYGGKLNV